MQLSEVIEALQTTDELIFKLPNGDLVPSHFHVTEIGKLDKHFIDCGGTIRTESVVSFQLFTADDMDHRLRATKLASIIELSQEKLSIPDDEVEVEYQGIDTIGKYRLDFDGKYFHLISMATACLANKQCGIPSVKKKVQLRDLQNT